jgi:hypothetical protein
MSYPGNPNCDGGHCSLVQGEVRVLPLGGSANLIVCLSCFNHEMAWRQGEIYRGRDFDLPKWDDLEVYNGAK